MLEAEKTNAPKRAKKPIVARTVDLEVVESFDRLDAFVEISRSCRVTTAWPPNRPELSLRGRAVMLGWIRARGRVCMD